MSVIFLDTMHHLSVGSPSGIKRASEVALLKHGSAIPRLLNPSGKVDLAWRKAFTKSGL